MKVAQADMEVAGIAFPEAPGLCRWVGRFFCGSRLFSDQDA
jgi:hypothetical protein